MLDVVIRGGQVVTPCGVQFLDIAIQGEKVAMLAVPGAQDIVGAARVIDATGKIIIPGGIDPHIHCNWPSPPDPEGGPQRFSAPPLLVSRAALFGGTTTLIDFAIWNPGETLSRTIERRDKDWHGQCHCDYAYHVMLQGQIPPRILEELPETIRSGFPTIKIYTTNGRPGREGRKIGYGDIWEILKVVAKCGGVTAIHAEEDDLVMHMYDKLIREGRVGFEHMAEVHSALSEDLSFRHIIRLAENVDGASLYMMHVSAAGGIKAIEESRARGYPIYGETLPHFMFYTSEDYRRVNGQIYHTYPSLKSEEDRLTLWSGTTSGAISTIATDGICTPLCIKVQGHRIDDTTGGHAGVEPRVSVMYTETVVKRGYSLERFVALVSGNAARIMGLYPRKGAIAAGSDADLVIFDPQASRRLSHADLHEADYSPWEGYEVAGWPAVTLLRGKVVVDNGLFHGDPMQGQRIARKIADEIVSGPTC
ncbi:MAG: hypothetical protein A3F74_27480 [Betaproteobacteria bacterium RIFCSPLOWO2_12_FULL_62_58]|nr:MAG: hypothetical protein A3F74_27480 [Betaproteobacteria bacterium RIFCSPLOWO2_12_FULL_62_58]